MSRQELDKANVELTDDAVRQMLLLAERLREATGGELDDESIQAVSEATGAPVEYVRVAARMLPEKRTKGVVANFRSAFLTLEPEVRTSVLSGLTATFCAGLHVLASVNSAPGNSFFDTLALIFLGLGIWNMSLARDARAGAISGALFGGVYFVIQGLVAYLLQYPETLSSPVLIVFLLGGALTGLVLNKLVSRFRPKLGIQDPARERQEMLRQLVNLQERLRSGEQSVTFLSVDVVGSTQIKASSDPLSVEFTFNEYHMFVENATRRFQGRVHSTAGDGMILAFDYPQQAFAAAKNLQTGIGELNMFRNKTGVPLVLRCGVHSGTVIAPQAGVIESVNFAHVIDVCAHLQKECPPGGVAVSDSAATQLPGGAASVGVTKVRAADVSGTVWMPRHLTAPMLSDTPPPPALPEGV